MKFYRDRGFAQLPSELQERIRAEQRETLMRDSLPAPVQDGGYRARPSTIMDYFG